MIRKQSQLKFGLKDSQSDWFVDMDLKKPTTKKEKTNSGNTAILKSKVQKKMALQSSYKWMETFGLEKESSKMTQNLKTQMEKDLKTFFCKIHI